ncbi:glycosyltransferase family 4 protein [Solibacillus sp. FSL K6-4121]|uniref:glycosyltransferase family 4 protein n=1 Tax=Solibacillus sp. FSL K6-4121 TaxID=2921505 RepID=UPI0030FA125B
MKIALTSVQVPFIQGGAEVLALNLKHQLEKKKHEVDIVTIPFKWYPPSALIDTMISSRLVDLSEINGEKIDLVIALKFPMYYCQHDNKVLWMMHQHRQAYELWGTEFGDLHMFEEGEEVRNSIINSDNRFLGEYKKRYTISKTVSNRLEQYNNLPSTPLYHPPQNYELLYCNGFDDYIFYPGRITHIKRQHLLIEAMAYTKNPVKLILAGSGDENYIKQLKLIIHEHNLGDRVKFVGMVSEKEKIDLYANALAVFNGPYEEDYGYVTLEGFFAKKPVITLSDSGGPLEFVKDGINGYVVDPEAKQLADRLDYLYENKGKAKIFGADGRTLLEELNINWDYVVERLTE